MRKVQGFTWTVADHDLLSSTDTWGETLVELGKAEPRIVAVTADLATTTKLYAFKDAFPDRCFNVGIAEQNLMAVAAGLAATGFIPVVCTYATFACLRAAEFVRTDIAYNRRNVKIIGTLAGVAFGQGGPTHHTIEDIALMRAIPGLVVLAPSDGHDMSAALRAAVAHDGPVYIRHGRGIEPVASKTDFRIGHAEVLRPGDDVAVIASGTTVHHALGAAKRAAANGIGVRVVRVSSLKPFDEATIVETARAVRRIVTVEDHSIINGLGSTVADAIAGAGVACGLRKLGHRDCYLGMGVPEDLMHLGGFDEDAIFEAVCALAHVAVPRDEDWADT